MKKIFTILTFVLILGIMTACIQDKSDQELTQGVSFSVNGESFEMVLVEGGTFTMGCTGEQGDDCEDDEKPAHEETLPTFHMGKYEVTQKLWTAVMGSVLNRSNNSGCEDCPVENISWKDTQEFITKLNILTGRSFRLPTEAEWEYAARGGNRSKGYKYSGSNKIDEVAGYHISTMT